MFAALPTKGQASNNAWRSYSPKGQTLISRCIPIRYATTNGRMPVILAAAQGSCLRTSPCLLEASARSRVVCSYADSTNFASGGLLDGEDFYSILSVASQALYFFASSSFA